MQVVEVLNPLAREFKSIGTLRKELAELQEELAKAHNQVLYFQETGAKWKTSILYGFWCFTCLIQVHLSETRVSSALDKLAQMETLVNDRLLQDGGSSASTAECTSLAPSTSSASRVVNKKPPRRSLNVSGPVQPYNPNLKNFWYPVVFSGDLKDDTMVTQWMIQAFTMSGVPVNDMFWCGLCVLRYQ